MFNFPRDAAYFENVYFNSKYTLLDNYKCLDIMFYGIEHTQKIKFS